MQNSVTQPLTNVQLELLKAFSHQLSDSDLIDLRKVLVSFFAERLVRQADKLWDEKGFSDKDVDKMLNTKMRKSKK